MKTSVAVVGAGRWGSNLVRNFAELGILRTICDLDRELLSGFLSKYPKVALTDSYTNVLQDRSIAGVVIATPSVKHYEMALSALIAGKHVFVEKPMSLDVLQAKELILLAEKKKLVLMVGHLLEYHPAVIKLKKIIDSGGLGKINYIYSNRLNLGKVRKEENILWSFAPHDISVVRMLLEEDPVEVTAVGANYLSPQLSDITISTLSFKNGVKAHIFVSWLHPFKEQRLVVVGDKKMAVFEDSAKDKLKIYDQRFVWKNRVPVAHTKGQKVIRFDSREPLRLECLHFIKCIRQEITPKTDGKSGLKVLEVLKACQKSLENRGTPVSLSELVQDKDYFVHPTAIVDDFCKIGQGCKIWHYSHIMRGASIGRNCSIGQNVYVGSKAVIGNNVKIQNNVSIYDGLVIEDNVFCGPSAVFTNVFTPRSFIDRRNKFQLTRLCTGSSIGANATVVCGNNIGAYALVGASAVVTKNIPDYALVYGNPARIKGWVCQCGNKLRFVKKSATCNACGRHYKKTSKQVRMI